MHDPSSYSTEQTNTKGLPWEPIVNQGTYVQSTAASKVVMANVPSQQGSDGKDHLRLTACAF
jgi:hypothetical protein